MHCLRCKKTTGTTGATMSVTQNGRHVMKGKCTGCGMTKTRFVSAKQKGKGFLGDMLTSVF